MKNGIFIVVLLLLGILLFTEGYKLGQRNVKETMVTPVALAKASESLFTPAEIKMIEDTYDNYLQTANTECQYAKDNGVYTPAIRTQCENIIKEIKQNRADFEALTKEKQ